MAGIDTHFDGEARLAPGATRRHARRRSRSSTRRERSTRTSRTACASTRELLDRFNAISAQLGEPLDADEMEQPLAEMGEVQERDRRGRRLEPRAHAGDRDGRHARAARRGRGEQRSPAASAGAWRCAGCCCRRPTCCCSTSRRTTSTPSRWPGWSSILAEYRGTVVAVTHDRYFLDNVAGWILELDRGKGIPYKGNYSGWLEQKQARLAQEEKRESARQTALARELEWAGMSPKARQAKSKARLAALRDAARRARRTRRSIASRSRSRRARLGDVVVEAQGSQGLRRPPADRGSGLLACRPAASSA